MERTASDTYLETQITTATPQRLRLMLVEGAIRLARRTIDLWGEDRNEEALESLIRCRGVVSELLSGVKDDGTPLARQVMGIYLFLFTTLTESQLTRDAVRLNAAIHVLEEERATWQAVCHQHPEPPPARPPADFGEEVAPPALFSPIQGETLSIEA
jgi:flagellar protein FliS